MGQGSKVIVLIGPMGCGKTTIGKLLAEQMNWPFYDADDFHPESNIEKMRAGNPLTDVDRFPWLKLLNVKIQQWLGEEKGCVLACSALKEDYRQLLGVDQQKVLTVYLKGSFELLQQRLSKRNHAYMNDALLQSQLETFEEPTSGIVADISPPPDKVAQIIREQLGL